MDLLDTFSSALLHEVKQEIFALDSSKSIILPFPRTGPISKQPTSTGRVRLTFVSKEGNRVVNLPCSDQDENFLKLLQTCQPVDEGCNKVLKLRASEFHTDFSPYEAGIVDLLPEALMPYAPQESTAVRAKLHELNIYSYSPGKSKPYMDLPQSYVDMPNSKLQIGSLVACLPFNFEGGPRFLAHKDNSVRCDWAASANGSAIPWVAYFSDSLHEVLPVTSGHCITIKYRLYALHDPRRSAGFERSLNPEQLPLYRPLKTILGTPDCVAEGCVLGIHLWHAYAHIDSIRWEDLRLCLKGTDMMLFKVLSALDARFKVVRPLSDKTLDEVKRKEIKKEELGSWALGIEALEWSPLGDTGVHWLNSPCHLKDDHTDAAYYSAEAPHTTEGHVSLAFLIKTDNYAEVDGDEMETD